jgi:hypothetical protein
METTMFDLEFENLRLVVRNARGHEHRLRPIAERAMALIEEKSAQVQPPRGGMRSPQGRLDLSSMGDEQAARAIADHCLAILALKL